MCSRSQGTSFYLNAFHWTPEGRGRTFLFGRGLYIQQQKCFYCRISWFKELFLCLKLSSVQDVFVVEWWWDEKRQKQRFRSDPLKNWSTGFFDNFKVASTSFKVDTIHIFVNTAKFLWVYYWQCNTGCLFKEVTLKALWLYDLSFTSNPIKFSAVMSAVKSWKMPKSSEKTCSELHMVWVKCSEGKNAWLVLLIRIGKINKSGIPDPLFQIRKNKITKLSNLLELSRKSCASAGNRLSPGSQASFLTEGFLCFACWEQVFSRERAETCWGSQPLLLAL